MAGRGALIERLKKQQAEQEKIAEAAATQPVMPTRAKGRAALLLRLHEEEEKKLGLAASCSKAQSEGTPEKGALESREKAESTERSLRDLSIIEEPETHNFRGTSGAPVDICCNYLRLTVLPNRGIFEYEVKFSPGVDYERNRKILVREALGEANKTKMYDGGACLYLSTKAFETECKRNVALPTDQTQMVTVTFIYKQQKRYGDRSVLHLYNVLFKRIMGILRFKKMGRNYFNPANKSSIAAHNLEIYPGYAMTVDEREDGLFLQMDTQSRVIRNETVYNIMRDLGIGRNPNFKQLINNELIGSVVLTKYNNKTYRIDDIEWKMNPRSTFETSEGEITFMDYYKKNYNLEIMDDQQPLLIHRKSVVEGDSKVERIICLIPELSFVTGLTDTMRSDFRVMKDVAAFTRLTPGHRLKNLMAFVEQVRRSPEATEVLAEWGLKIADELTYLNARVLDEEIIQFGRGTGRGADWSRQVGKNMITGPKDINNWIIFYTPRDERTANNLARVMLNHGQSMGCRIAKPILHQLNNDNNESWKRGCDRLTPETDVAVFIFPTIRADRYNIIKTICSTQLGIASQVIISKNLINEKKCASVISKVALQIECKLGGSLWTVKFPVSGWMVVGMDVCHGEGKKSVCGFISSLNQSFSRWYSSVIFQEGELGDHYRQKFQASLLAYKKENGTYPQVILFFRDGVGEGQLNYVQQYEVMQFRLVLQEMSLDTKLVFIVVQKRVNTRIFLPARGNELENPRPGTVVDHSITSRQWYDFYLVPQTVLQGTVTPTHYVVLLNEANIKPDHIQRFSYKMCHLYYNWSGTIRVPAPCLYAHKLASVVGQVTRKQPHSRLDTRLHYL